MAIEKIKIFGAILELPAKQHSSPGCRTFVFLKAIATYAPAFLGYNNSVLARVLVEKFMVEDFMVEEFMVKKSGLKLGVNMSWVEMSCDLQLGI